MGIVVPKLLISDGFPENWRALYACVSFHTQTHQQTNLSPVLSSQAFIPLEVLKVVGQVKGIEPSLSAWEADNEMVLCFGY